jgi:hypothetical protein
VVNDTSIANHGRLSAGGKIHIRTCFRRQDHRAVVSKIYARGSIRFGFSIVSPLLKKSIVAAIRTPLVLVEVPLWIFICVSGFARQRA